MSGWSARGCRVLLVVFSDRGHLNPMIGIAQWLERAGAEVFVFSCQNDVSRSVRDAGLRAPSYLWRDPPADGGVAGEVRAAPGAQAADPESVTLTKRMQQPAWLKHWLQRVLLTPLEAQAERLADVVASVAPDVLCVDAMAYAGVMVAERLGKPWASIATALNPLTPEGFRSTWVDAWARLADARRTATQRDAPDVTFTVSDAISPWLTTVFTVEDLAPRGPSSPPLHYVGPSRALGPRGDEPGGPAGSEPPRGERPLVYVSFGSVASPELRVFQCFLDALAPEEADVVIVAKDLLGHPAFADVPPHVSVVAYAPQLQILGRAAVMVTHGGYNSVSECLDRSVPMLVVPLLFEQSLNAHFASRAGVAEVLEAEAATVDGCRAALLRLLSPGSAARTAAQRMGRLYASRSGAERAAELVTQLAKTREPIFPR